MMMWWLPKNSTCQTCCTRKTGCLSGALLSIIAIASFGVISGAFAFKAGTFGKWGSEESGSILKFFNGSDACLSTWSGILLTLIALILIFAVSNQLMGKNIAKYAISFLALFALTCLVRLISSQVTFSKYLEYAFWALILGLVISNLLKVPDWLKPAIQTEFYIRQAWFLWGPPCFSPTSRNSAFTVWALPGQ